MQHLQFPEMGSLDPTLDTKTGTTAIILAAALSSKLGLCGSSPGRALPTSGPLAGAFSKDTLAWGVLHIIARGRGGVHLLCIGELAHQLHLEIFSSLVFLPSVDEHFVLQRNDTIRDLRPRLGGRGPSTAGSL